MEEEKRNFVINYINQPTFFVCVEFRSFTSSDFMERSCDLWEKDEKKQKTSGARAEEKM